MERNSGMDQGSRPPVKAESSSSTLLTTLEGFLVKAGATEGASTRRIVEVKECSGARISDGKNDHKQRQRWSIVLWVWFFNPCPDVISGGVSGYGGCDMVRMDRVVGAVVLKKKQAVEEEKKEPTTVL